MKKNPYTLYRDVYFESGVSTPRYSWTLPSFLLFHLYGEFFKNLKCVLSFIWPLLSVFFDQFLPFFLPCISFLEPPIFFYYTSLCLMWGVSFLCRFYVKKKASDVIRKKKQKGIWLSRESGYTCHSIKSFIVARDRHTGMREI